MFKEQLKIICQGDKEVEYPFIILYRLCTTIEDLFDSNAKADKILPLKNFRKKDVNNLLYFISFEEFLYNEKPDLIRVIELADYLSYIKESKIVKCAMKWLDGGIDKHLYYFCEENNIDYAELSEVTTAYRLFFTYDFILGVMNSSLIEEFFENNIVYGPIVITEIRYFVVNDAKYGIDLTFRVLKGSELTSIYPQYKLKLDYVMKDDKIVSHYSRYWSSSNVQILYNKPKTALYPKLGMPDKKYINHPRDCLYNNPIYCLKVTNNYDDFIIHTCKGDKISTRDIRNYSFYI